MRSRTSTAAEPATYPEAVAAETTQPAIVGEGARAPRRRTSKTTPAATDPEPVMETQVSNDEPSDAPGEQFTSAKREVLNEMDKEQPKAPGRSSDTLRMGVGYDAIVETLYRIDAGEMFDRVREAIARGKRSSRGDYGSLVKELDAAADVSAEALQLAMNAAVARESLEAEAHVIESELRERAQESLVKTGAKVTLQAIEDRMIVEFHDEYRALKLRRARVKHFVEYIEGLTKVAQERQRDLRQMVGSASKS
jgi:hypothetical protein